MKRIALLAAAIAGIGPAMAFKPVAPAPAAAPVVAPPPAQTKAPAVPEPGKAGATGKPQRTKKPPAPSRPAKPEAGKPAEQAGKGAVETPGNADHSERYPPQAPIVEASPSPSPAVEKPKSASSLDDAIGRLKAFHERRTREIEEQRRAGGGAEPSNPIIPGWPK